MINQPQRLISLTKISNWHDVMKLFWQLANRANFGKYLHRWVPKFYGARK
jgi:hypothetical protein